MFQIVINILDYGLPSRRVLCYFQKIFIARPRKHVTPQFLSIYMIEYFMELKSARVLYLRTSY